jgi:hypothetical protein
MSTNALGPNDLTETSFVSPSVPGYLPEATTAALASGSSQVLIVSATAPGRFISSVPNANPIQNLRNGLILNWQSAITGSSVDPSGEWGGPLAVTDGPLWAVCGPISDLTPSANEVYPATYWACGNGGGGNTCQNDPPASDNGGTHILLTQSRFFFACGNDALNEPLLMYVR